MRNEKLKNKIKIIIKIRKYEISNNPFTNNIINNFKNK